MSKLILLIGMMFVFVGCDYNNNKNFKKGDILVLTKTVADGYGAIHKKGEVVGFYSYDRDYNTVIRDSNDEFRSIHERYLKLFDDSVDEVPKVEGNIMEELNLI